MFGLAGIDHSFRSASFSKGKSECVSVQDIRSDTVTGQKTVYSRLYTHLFHPTVAENIFKENMYVYINLFDR